VDIYLIHSGLRDGTSLEQTIDEIRLEVQDLLHLVCVCFNLGS
jgi:hypothetical protein